MITASKVGPAEKRKQSEAAEAESELSDIGDSCDSCGDDDRAPPPKRARVKHKPSSSKKSTQDAVSDMPTIARVLGASKWIGCHVSGPGGPHNAIPNALNAGCNAVAFFLRSSRTWKSSPYAVEHVEQFKARSQDHNYIAASHFLPHGSYLINLGNSDDEKRAQSYTAFVDELQRCKTLGIQLYNFHPGSTVGNCERSKSIQLIAECINRAHQDVPDVITVVENMAGQLHWLQGNTIGNKFEELHDIIDGVENKERIGVCLDTCHMFAAGYDIRSEKAYGKTFKAFDDIVGFKYLRALHLNDSKEPLGSKKDRHESIGKGCIGLPTFKRIMKDARFDGMPMTLETPVEKGLSNAEELKVQAEEIKLLYSLVEDSSTPTTETSGDTTI
ncbi:DNA-(apurinic or apyrimidinic site) lyase [Sorochytrium milnesiophthora]